MKKALLIIIIWALAGEAWCQSYGAPTSSGPALLDLPGVMDYAVAAAKQSRAVLLIGISGGTQKGIEIPVRVLHDSNGVGYLETAIGADTENFTNGRFLLNIDADITSSASRLLFNNSWAQAHVTQALKLPDFWVGPSILVPLPQDNFQFKHIMDFVKLSISARLL